MKPLNRRLLIEVIEEEPQQGAFFVPVEEKIEEFLSAKVIACAEDCASDLVGKQWWRQLRWRRFVLDLAPFLTALLAGPHCAKHPSQKNLPSLC